MEKYVQIKGLNEARDGETVCASYPNSIKNVSGLKQAPQMLAAEQDAICGKCKLLVWRKVSETENQSDEYIKKSDVIAMLKEMQIDAAKCNGFIAGMVTQIWVIKDLLGKNIEKLGGIPYIVKDGKLVDTEAE